MKYSTRISTLIFGLTLFSVMLTPVIGHAQFKDLLNKAKSTVSPSEDEIGPGLKQALEFGVREAVDKLSADKGYLESPFKILIPEEAKIVINSVKRVPGFQDVEQQLIDKMNKAAEIAARKATPIFVDAIRALTIRDALNILMGEQDAATRYLETQTRANLYNAFLPVIQSALDEVNAREYWSTVMTAYNKIPFVQKANPALDDHVNQKALDGMFGLIQEKEAKIRGDKTHRTTDLLQKIFARQDKS